MGLIDKINRWRGFYDESVVPRQELAAFPVKFESFESFAAPFGRSMGREIFKAMDKDKLIEPGVPCILWGDRPATNEYVYIYYVDVLTDELLEKFDNAQTDFELSIDKNIKTSIISLVCVEKSSPAFERYCRKMPRNEGFDLSELVAGIAFDEQQLHTGILTNCPGERNNRNMMKEFLRMIRAAENCY